ncbi:hypothetical protein CN97_19125 [Haematobacter massiliensis]|uniref:Uncharacterized protein n=1 Tax=Haematobacter massiliensis TaxID=195105 RepID=A0A086Y2E1_9RHOB|nr:hypothetical protein [Haematobacter massiliensis]KFI28441.1 hypothetical protein CN97_19125 [Haematobacter massiliensis]OWJ84677.1 hypothetical protein CDV51_13440 [Haematobacter massiliensis]QBJ26357.1 hypothetical protein HmaOT1_18635 [Haematobacter massiliensis]
MAADVKARPDTASPTYLYMWRGREFRSWRNPLRQRDGIRHALEPEGDLSTDFGLAGAEDDPGYDPGSGPIRRPALPGLPRGLAFLR